MKRGWLGATALVVAVLAAGAWIERGELAQRLMSRIYHRALGTDAVAQLPDGLHVGLCGTGSPLPDPTRAGACTLIIAGKSVFVVDSGENSVKTMALMNLPPARVNAAFITHFHSDHIADLGELMLQHWAGGSAQAPLPIYGPTGVDQVVNGFMSAYGQDRGYRIAHHGPKVVPPAGFGGEARPFAIDPNGPDVTLIDQGDLKVIAFAVDHGPVKPAVGYLFIYKGRRVLVSGDTAATPRLVQAGQGADVIVHEGLAPNLVAIQRQAALDSHKDNIAQIMHDILGYHTTPEQAAAEAEQAHARFLLFTHVIPPLPLEALEGPFLGRSRQIFHGKIRVGKDGDFLTLPAGSDEIRVGNRIRTFL